VKRKESCWCSLLLLLLIVRPSLFSQAVTVADEGNNDSVSIPSTVLEKPVARLDAGTDGQAASSPPQTAHKSAQEPYGWHTAIYPVLAWAPVFGASVTLPPLPSQPIATPGPSGSTSGSLNGAYFGGVRVERGKWSGDALFMWAALSGERRTPSASIHLDFVFGNAMAGREVLPGLYVEGGARRLALDLRATVESSRASRSPGFWDPLVGLSYRRQLVESGEFYSTEMAEDSAQVQTTT